MLGNFIKLLKKIMTKFNKLNVGIQAVSLVVIALGIYNFMSKKNFLSGNILNALKVREGLGEAKSLTFYSMEGCPHCTRFQSTWEELKEKVPKETCIGTCRKIDSKDSEVGKNGVSGFPTIMLCDGNNEKVVEYQGERSADALIKFCKDNCA